MAASAVISSVSGPGLAAEPGAPASPPAPSLAATASAALVGHLDATEPAFRPNVRAAMAVGLFTMLVPGIIGGTRTALGVSDGDKTAGLLVASGGFALAPIFSHMITHEWERAAQFGILPVLTTAVGTAYISQQPHAVYHGDMGTRTAFGILLGLGLIGAVVGVFDASLAAERARDRTKPRHARFFVAPGVSAEGGMLTLGGDL
jgi:hypothetical protein